MPEAQHIVGSQPLAPAEKGPLVHADSYRQDAYTIEDDSISEEEMHSLRRVAGHIPITAYILCAVEFAERGSFYGQSILMIELAF